MQPKPTGSKPRRRRWRWSWRSRCSRSCAGVLIAVAVTRSITGPIGRAVAVANRVAIGDTGVTFANNARDETGMLLTALQAMTAATCRAAAAARQVAAVDVGARVAVRSHQDAPGQAFQQLLATMQGLTQETNTLVAAAHAATSRRAATPAASPALSRNCWRASTPPSTLSTPVNEAAAVLQQVSNKDLTARMTGSYQGDYNTIKEALNQAAANLDDAPPAASPSPRAPRSRPRPWRR